MNIKQGIYFSLLTQSILTQCQIENLYEDVDNNAAMCAV